jgi:DnaJ-class molecular chaperone
MKKDEGIVEKYEAKEVTDDERKRAYKKACDIIEVNENDSKKHITGIVRNLFKINHPDKNMDAPEEVKKHCEKRFIEVNCAMGFIKAYREEQGTWTD